jgi:hypothetical protein
MLKKIAIFFLLCAPLLSGFFPSSVKSRIVSISGNKAVIDRPFPVNGMSGIVIHDFGKGRSAISAIAVQTSSSKVKLQKGDLLGAANLPGPSKTAVVGDRVIGGYLYDNVLLIAPNARTYTSITTSTPKHWIHPDLFAAYLGREGDSSVNRENLAGFAKEAQVGLVYIVGRDRAVLLDPISGHVVARKSYTPKGSESRYPFYMRFSRFRSGLFGGSEGDYYKEVEALLQ